MVHLPVAGDHRLAGRRRAISRQCSLLGLGVPRRPGRSPCSMNSSDAPPPVLTWSTRSARPNSRIAAALSPPPTTVKRARRRDRVGDGARAGRERRELEHAHRAVPEHGRRVGRRRRRRSRRSRGRCRGPSTRRGSTRAVTVRRLGVGGDVLRDHEVGRDLDPAGLEQAAALVDHARAAPASRRRACPARAGT